MKPGYLIALCYLVGTCCVLCFAAPKNNARIQHLARMQPALNTLKPYISQYTPIGLIIDGLADDETLLEVRWLAAPRNIERATYQNFRRRDTLLVISTKDRNDSLLTNLLAQHTFITTVTDSTTRYMLIRIKKTGE